MATEKDYLAIAKQRVHQPSKIKSYRRLFIYGRNKRGKTRFGVSAGRDETLVIDPEAGTDTMTSIDPFVWPIEKWADTQEAYGAIRTGKLTPNFFKQGESSTPFSWVNLDGLTRMNNMALKFVRKTQEQRDLDRIPGFVEQRDYGKSGELMKQMLANYHGLKMNVIMTAQEKAKPNKSAFSSDDEDEGDMDFILVPDLPDSVRSAVNAIVEVIGRLYTVKVEIKGVEKIQRRLWVAVHDRYDTGYRSDYLLPDMFKNPTIPKLVSAMLQGGAN